MAKDPENEAELTEILANEILDKIQKCEQVEYSHVIVKGDIDIAMLNLQKDNGKFLVVPSIKITDSRIEGCLEFYDTIFKDLVDFGRTTFSQRISFRKAQFNKSCYFSNAHFVEDADFREIQVIGYANFVESVFCSAAIFWSAHFCGDSDFRSSHFDGETTNFVRTQFDGYADFRDAKFSNDIDFEKAKIGIDITFKNAKFSTPKSQELGCRIARRRLEDHGDKDEAEYYFYHEMEAKRRQKPWYIRYPEYVFVQLIFGYGVHPFRLMFCWFLVAVIFALFYSVNGGIISKLPASSLPQPWSYFVECFYFSIVTAVTPGYGKYELTSWVYQVIASAEAIFGTFMWAAFIATFARKYMR